MGIEILKNLGGYGNMGIWHHYNSWDKTPRGRATLTRLAKNLCEDPFFLDYETIGDPGAEALAIALENNITVESLYLRHNYIGPSGVDAIVKALGKNPILCRFSLSHNPIGDKGAQHLSKVLITTHFPDLKILYLNECLIGDVGAEAIARAIERTGLKALHLWGNKIGNVGAQAIARAIRCTDLEELRLASNNIEDVGAKAIETALKTNSSLRRINLNGNDISDYILQKIQKIIASNKIIQDSTNSESVYEALQTREGIKEFTLVITSNRFPWEAAAKWLKEGTGQKVQKINIAPGSSLSEQDIESGARQMMSQSKRSDLIIQLKGINLSFPSPELKEAITRKITIQKENSEKDAANIALDKQEDDIEKPLDENLNVEEDLENNLPGNEVDNLPGNELDNLPSNELDNLPDEAAETPECIGDSSDAPEALQG